MQGKKDSLFQTMDIRHQYLVWGRGQALLTSKYHSINTCINVEQSRITYLRTDKRQRKDFDEGRV